MQKNNQMLKILCIASILFLAHCNGAGKSLLPLGMYKVNDHASFSVSALDESDTKKILGKMLIVTDQFIAIDHDTCEHFSCKKDVINAQDILYEVKMHIEKRTGKTLPPKLTSVTVECNGNTWDSILWYYIIFDKKHLFAMRDGELFFLDKAN